MCGDKSVVDIAKSWSFIYLKTPLHMSTDNCEPPNVPRGFSWVVRDLVQTLNHLTLLFVPNWQSKQEAHLGRRLTQVEECRRFPEINQSMQ